MKHMLIMRSRDEAAAAAADMDVAAVINAMGEYNEALLRAGVLLAGEGLSDSGEGFVVDVADTTPVVTDGPYGETHELFTGFWIIQTATREEAVEWARRCPLGPGSTLEVRRVTEMEDVAEFADDPHIHAEQRWRDEHEGS